ncbi:MAG TPA: DUF998 domain-containing protein [Longimicrobiaceae bacterium]|nr:DUF998 domain-containing protein [Longimicrobiaceae bacterium]
MNTIEVPQVRSRTTVHPVRGGTRLPAALLVCGIASSILYAAMVAFVATRWEGYSSASQTVSELSAIGAPTRPLWIALAAVYTLLVIAFGCGVWLAAGRNRRLRVVGGLQVATGLIGPLWPPMHLRGAEPTLTDTMHIVFAAGWLVLTLLTVGFGAAALGRRFRIYSMATLAVFVVFGVLTGVQGPRIAADLPTPWIGVWERINIGAFLLWMVVLAVTLLRARTGRQREGVAG